MKRLMLLGCAMLLLAFGASQARAHGGGGDAMGDWDKADACSQEKGHYAVHMTTYQQKRAASETLKLQEVGSVQFKEEFQSYCGGVPKTGRMWMAFDLYNEELRALPISIRIVEDEAGGHEHAAGEGGHDHAIVSVPPTIYRDGTARVYVEIPEAGHYAAIVKLEKVGPAIAHGPHRAGDPGEWNRVVHRHGSSDPTQAEIDAVDPTYRFPFTVGLAMKRELPWFVSNPGFQTAGALLVISGLIGGVQFYRNGKRKTRA
ncbi:MAG: hypothetical protein C3F12_03400 [Candidatus Methylomirabilota bacterium]|nr:hypothetical protein [candidate division NC10 bacterium]PWB47743.1 MAG: hypothetical protein C3F12_03400 [candidate division NC10 bacterium]